MTLCKKHNVICIIDRKDTLWKNDSSDFSAHSQRNKHETFIRYVKLFRILFFLNCQRLYHGVFGRSVLLSQPRVICCASTLSHYAKLQPPP